MIDAEQYKRIDAIFKATLELRPEQRPSYISEVCEGDEALIKEVECLLASDEQDYAILNLPAFELAAPLLASDKPELPEGECLGHYRIISLLGAGGMGQVYLAEDTRLNRKVALKLLPKSYTNDALRLRRFQQEARAASALNHPNILTIYDIWEIENRHIIVTEYIEGETLRQRMKRELVSVEEATAISIQIASALWAAHQAGIIHRDIKPENIMVRRDGLIKVLDFGLAKLVEEPTLMADTGATDASLQKGDKQLLEGESEAKSGNTVKTDAGLLMGTLPYMSPEQLQGEATDARTDLFSLGVVIFEMVTSCLPFAGETNAELCHSILEEQPTPLPRHSSGEVLALQPIVAKALCKNREGRYQTASDLLKDLKGLNQSGTIAGAIQSSRIIWKRRLLIATGILLLVSLCAGILSVLPSRKLVATPRKSIAVLPFKPIGTDAGDEYLRLGIADTLINKLNGVRQLIVRPLASVMKYGKADQDPLAAGNALGVDVVLDGQIQKLEDRYRVTVQLWRVSDSASLSSYQCDEQCASIFDLQDAISERVANVLVARLTAEEQRYLAKRYTDNKEVYELYLKGRFYWNKKTHDDFKKSVEYFNQAIKLDENYAPAYSGLADAYFLLAWSEEPEFEVLEKGKAAALKAIEIDDSLAEAHASLGYAKFWHDWDWQGAQKEFERAIALKPNYATAISWYAYMLGLVGQSDKAISMAKAALELEPLSVTANIDLGIIYIYTRHPDEAIEQLRKAIDMEPANRTAPGFLLFAYHQKGMYDEFMEEWLRSAANPEEAETIRKIYAGSGFKGFCQYLLGKVLKRQAEHGDMDPFAMACRYAEVGDNDKAMEWLEKSYQAHQRMMTNIKVDRRLDKLRSDPRFKEMIRRVGLPD